MDNILCMTYDEVVPAVLSESNYKQLKARGGITVVGRGGNGNEVLISYDSLPMKYQLLVQAKYGNPYETMAKSLVTERYQQTFQNNAAARRFYQGEHLGLDAKQQEGYVKAASMLDTLTQVMEDKKWIKKTLNITLEAFWAMFFTEYSWKEEADGSRTKIGTRKVGLIDMLGISLPSSEKLKKKWRTYREHGFEYLIDGRLNNDNARKVTDKLENLILSLYAKADPKPYASEVCLQYIAFLEGRAEIVDCITGELVPRETFINDNVPAVLSESTVKFYLNKPENKALLDSIRTSGLEFSNVHRPIVHRKAPTFALSKISMDDIAVPFKMHDGSRVWSYQIFDVASQAIIGVAFARDKSVQLVKDAVMDMVRRIVLHGWGMPAEIEVEQHLNSGLKGKQTEDGEFTPDLLTEGFIFPFVRFCRGGNPREKRAEGFIKAKKYGVQAKRTGFQYRPFARLEANRMNADRDKVVYGFAEIVTNEMEDIAAYNAAMHPKQDVYPGLTRWEVLQKFQNPNLVAPNLAAVLPYVGQFTKTTVRRSMYVTVQHNKYVLPSPEILGRLQGLEVDAYYLPSDLDVKEVYLYQDGDFICRCGLVTPFQEARIEQTPEDHRMMEKQLGYISKFDANIRKRRQLLAKLAVVDAEKLIQQEGDVKEVPEVLQESTSHEGGYVQSSSQIEEKYWWEDPEEIARRAHESL